MLKPVLIVSAFALAAPALAETNSNIGNSGTIGQAQSDQSVATSPSGPASSPNATDAAKVDRDSVRQTGADAHVGHSSTGTQASEEGTEIGATTSGQAGEAGTVVRSGTTTGALTSGQPVTAQTVEEAGSAAGTVTARGATGAGFTGVGGPNENLLDVAHEMIGDQARVQQVMSGRDGGMKASDLLNQAMLTLIQRRTNAPR